MANNLENSKIHISQTYEVIIYFQISLKEKNISTSGNLVVSVGGLDSWDPHMKGIVT